VEQEQLSKMKDENRRLRERLRQTELIIEAQKNLSDTWSAGSRGERARMIEQAAALSTEVGVSAACTLQG
jgi:hypothetical protein